MRERNEQRDAATKILHDYLTRIAVPEGEFVDAVLALVSERVATVEAERDDLREANALLGGDEFAFNAAVQSIRMAEAQASDRLRQQLAEREAVIEKVREYADQADPDNVDETPMWPTTVRTILASSPQEALAEHDQGVSAGTVSEVIQHIRDVAQRDRYSSTHLAMADWLEREDFSTLRKDS